MLNFFSVRLFHTLLSNAPRHDAAETRDNNVVPPQDTTPRARAGTRRQRCPTAATQQDTTLRVRDDDVPPLRRRNTRHHGHARARDDDVPPLRRNNTRHHGHARACDDDDGDDGDAPPLRRRKTTPRRRKTTPLTLAKSPSSRCRASYCYESYLEYFVTCRIAQYNFFDLFYHKSANQRSLRYPTYEKLELIT